jgi:4-amino-4-deoxy-L-arabinose transferase-like glycosyltransferase
MSLIVETAFGNWTRTLCSLFITALLVRMIFTLTLQDGFYFPDSVEYSSAAINLINKGELGPTYNRPPGYAVFLAAIYAFFGESIRAVRLVEGVLGAFLGVVITLIGRRLGGETVARIAGMLWSFYPIAIFITGLVYPTGLLALLLACGVFIFIPQASQPLSKGRAFVAGLLWGLAALTTPIVLATIGVVTLWVIFWARADRIRLASLVLAGAAITVVPWMIRDFYVYGHLVAIEPRAVEHLPNMHSTTEEASSGKFNAFLSYSDKYATRFGTQFLRFWSLYPQRIAMDRPGYREEWHDKDSRVVKDTIFGANGMITVVSILTSGPLFLFALIGTAAMWFGQKRRREVTLLWGIILSFAIGYSMFVGRTRYRIPIEPYLIILSAYGLKRFWDLLASHFFSRHVVADSRDQGLGIGVR